MKLNVLWLASALLLSTAFPSCSNEGDMTKQEVSTNKKTLKFRIAIPTGEPVTYATIHDADEWGIESLWMLEYAGSPTTTSQLIRKVDIKNSLTGTGPVYNYEEAYDMGTQKKDVTHSFYFIANVNASALNSLSIGSNIAQLESVMAPQVLAENANCSTLLENFSTKKRIPMVGVSTYHMIGDGIDLSVYLKRILTRFDVRVNVPGYIIKEMYVNNARAKSSLLPNETLTSYDRVNHIAPFTAPQMTAKEYIPKAFYLYENKVVEPQKENKQTFYIRVEKGGKPALLSYVVDQATKRNFRYELNIGDPDAPFVEPKEIPVMLVIKDWQLENISSPLSFVSAQLGNTVGGGTVATAPTYTKQRMLTVSKDKQDVTLNFTSRLVDHSKFEIEGLTGTQGHGLTVGKYLGDGTTPENIRLEFPNSQSGRTTPLTLKFNENTSGADKIDTVYIKDLKADGTVLYSYRFYITQKGN